ncbi:MULTISPECIES: BMP family ABC transporter substrate-binding protein [unclassified Actinomyces]|uniref:BMP family ABC transporter substrate-binding protein n=1 Tax=unclassified Actinomyces TaxID=2609248 RepID=UPI0008A37C4A|nr:MULTISPECIES: BMP family ABC transporter substrate-binding protein [unclassified Actinomyces]MDU4286500.1 BMP family ABC transporter substrate-binding protein [Actinomyces sp.]MDU5232309.1 BMP family ABC transporter substrate-binding protein [Actinomyces sp.]MDU6756519.1 BMP family ABC transporter substrate-binding protein [Actinomyces sp.]MDU7238563.1 BMP family ABC transporter substrate-binding protein [Actinomyces sp.]OFR31941.1 hypothetical protein HMPREF2891_02405 [Actinomyces sp. HMSC
MRKISLFLISALSVVALAAGCGTRVGEPNPAEVPTSGQGGGTVLIMNQPAGNPFADLVFAGMEKAAQEKGLKAQQIPGVQAGAYEQQLRSAAQAGNNPIAVLWDDLGNAVARVAPEFPDTKFLVIDSAVDPKLDNVQTVLIDSSQSSYLAGVVAASLTHSKKIGFVGGQDMGVVNEWACGFEAGLKSVDPAVDFIVNYAGTFTDPQKGQQIANSMAGEGIDVIFQAANQTGLGVINGAADRGIKAIGSDTWQGDVAEGSVPWSALKDAGAATYTSTINVLEDKFVSGLFVYDSTEGAPLYDQRDYDALDPETQEMVDQVEQQLRDGAVKVSCR